MSHRTGLRGKVVFVIGGSAGLGKEMSKVMSGQGAHIMIFSRKQKLLGEAIKEIIEARLYDSQVINAVVADMGVSSNAHSILTSQPKMPDTLYCVAGGTATELGFLIDLEPEIFERCMTNNYYSSLWPAHAVLRQWVEDDKTAEIPKSPRLRKIIFVNSTASLCPVPGYVAYSAAKAAQRSLADTMRLEAMRYSGPVSTYAVQCIFAHNFITPTFIEEQKNKPELTKLIEGTNADLSNLERDFPYASKIAPEVVDAVASGDFAVLDKRLEPQLVWANMIGTSPKRGWGIVGSLLAFFISLLFPFISRGMEKECKRDALHRRKQTPQP